ncbi:uncharacterized protein LOC133898365 isoform X2 [Phragmites australis]|uniref:uncharacterized protein LOC133898365 isoform X2 n=1 Tax=Phragmites australis TaxID=29695 RepID=UPI002D779D49|nr:uncharacterized protein LOC133898365 isoform X2 [Phragmites australis]
MEKNGLLGVRKKLPPGKRLRSKLVAPVPAGGGGALAKAIADYLASDSYMYAPLASAPPPPPPPPQPKAAPSAAVPSAPPAHKTGSTEAVCGRHQSAKHV